MVSIQNLEFELQDLLKKKKYSEIIFEITTKTKEEERNAGLFVLLGISRISSNKKNKSQIELALSDFKKGYLKEKTSENGLNALVNFILASAILSDFENTNVDFNEIKNFYQKTPKNFQNKRAINIAMTTIYSRLSDHEEMLFHLKKIIGIMRIMSGDNLHGKQPIKFYSEKITLSKVELLERHLSLGEKVSDLDEKHKEWSKKLSA